MVIITIIITLIIKIIFLLIILIRDLALCCSLPIILPPQNIWSELLIRNNTDTITKFDHHHHRHIDHSDYHKEHHLQNHHHHIHHHPFKVQDIRILIYIVLIVRKTLVKRYFSFFLIRVILFRRRHCLL